MTIVMSRLSRSFSWKSPVISYHPSCIVCVRAGLGPGPCRVARVYSRVNFNLRKKLRRKRYWASWHQAPWSHGGSWHQAPAGRGSAWAIHNQFLPSNTFISDSRLFLLLEYLHPTGLTFHKNTSPPRDRQFIFLLSEDAAFFRYFPDSIIPPELLR